MASLGAFVRVVVADDDPDIRGLLAEYIARDRTLALVGTASNGDEAVACCQEQHPDVVLMDMAMPGRSGVDACRTLTSTLPGIRVIALSGYGDRDAVTEMLSAGAVGYLVKGARFRDLIAAIHRAANDESSLSPHITNIVVGELRDQLVREQRTKSQRDTLEARLRGVLDNDGLRVVFQPVVDLATGKPIGYEALARFQGEPHQTPDVWFADAASVGLGVTLELAAITKALEVFTPEEAGDGAYLALNLSPDCILTDNLRVLSGTPFERVVIEVTEHARVEDYALLTSALAHFREHGIRLAIDDAGAGFASLRHILELSPDFIKVDISLTRGIDHDRGRRALARGLISFGEEMGIKIIGEGVETQGELDVLRDLGVGYVQGYLVGRPQQIGFRAAAASGAQRRSHNVELGG